jgi:hypothetical protein
MKESIRLIRNGNSIVMLVNGRLTADMPAEAAMDAAKALMTLAKQIENDSNPAKTIMDQAILMRAGVGVGFSDNPLILKDAFKEAQYNRDLRRYMTNAPGIDSGEIMGTPIITGGKREKTVGSNKASS